MERLLSAGVDASVGTAGWDTGVSNLLRDLDLPVFRELLTLKPDLALGLAEEGPRSDSQGLSPDDTKGRLMRLPHCD